MAHDFRNKTFQKVLRGYAPEEVDDYIAYLNEEYRKLERRTADSERKLSLALKKLDESTKNGAADASVGPAAREAAAKLLREADARRSEMLAMAEQQANETAERIVRDAEVRAEAVVAEAVGQAEAILAEAKAQAEVHKNDVKTIYAAARGMYDEIGAFREKLFGLYNEHLDAIEEITDSAGQFMEGIDGQYPEGAEDADDADNTDDLRTEEVTESEETPEPETFAEAEELSDEEPMPEEESEDELPAVEFPEEELYEEETEPEFAEPEAEPEIGDDVASNLAFMDRLFASVKQAEESETEKRPMEDLYIDLPDDFEEEEFADFEEESAESEAEEEFYEDELPAITIDWKNRSAAPVEFGEEAGVPDESTDFRPAEGFDDFAEEYEEDGEAYEDGEYEENYDDYVPTDDADGLTEEAPAADEPEDDEDEEEDEGLRAMDALFREDKSKRDMSLTDEFNIIFDDSKSNANVKEIRRQPMVSPEAPKNPKKHKNF